MSRNEELLTAIINDTSYTEEPQSRVETILKDYLNNVTYTDEPQSRIEALLIAVFNNMPYTDEPQSRNEAILKSIVDRTPYTDAPRSRIETLLLQLKEKIEGGGTRPTVPQVGVWQYKSTPTTGFLIIGKDDDTTDSAQFVRMVNGYGFPVVLNTSYKARNQRCVSDASTEDTTYPEGSQSVFPEGCTIEQLNRYVINNNKGEIAQHDHSEGKTWSSNNLVGTALDDYYTTYTAGGGTKSKEELKTAIMEKYADTDIAQGVPRLMSQRELIEDSIGGFVYTIGTWGGHNTFVIDDIEIGESTPVEELTQVVSRQLNYMGDGVLSEPASSTDPYYMFRDSGALTPDNIEEALDKAYDQKKCIDIFHHLYLTNASKWQDFKTTLDAIKAKVDEGKIQVITRKQYYDLGEFTENPINGISIKPKEIAYALNSTLTKSDFICTATLSDAIVVTCGDDCIVDFSNVDTTTEGQYTVYLQYRGKFAQCTVNISAVVPTNYLLRNASFSGAEGVGGIDFGNLETPINLVAGKKYRFQFIFKAETTTIYSTHYMTFTVAGANKTWRTATDSTFNTITGYSVGNISFDVDVTTDWTIDKLARCTVSRNTQYTAWDVTDAYIYEIEGD